MLGRTAVGRRLTGSHGSQKAMSIVREMQIDAMVDEIIQIANEEPDNQRAKIRMQARI